jgi:asparagine synthase (glutamine-hydrolysing)
MLQFDEVDDALDREALAEYLGSGYVLGPRTILRGVRKLMPGQMLIADDEGCRFRDYWQWPVGHGTWRSIDEAIEEFLPILEKALDRQLRADVPIGLFLSGGTDSRLLAATATRRLDRQVGALTVGFSDSRFDESGVAIDSAAALGLPIDRLALTEKDLLSEIPQVLEATDEPLWDTSAIPTYLLCGAARRKFTVAISGDGGDELFGGYPTYLLDRPAALFRRLPAAGQRMLRAAANLLPAGDGYLDFAEKAKRFTAAAGHPSAAAHPRYKHLLLDRNQPEFWRDAPAGNPFAGFEAAYDAAADLGLGETERLLYADFHTFMVDDCLVKMDRMSMAHSLEVRVPLLDNDIIDFAARLPIEWKLRGRTLKFFLKRTLKRLAPELPVDLPKRGFTPPMAAWLNGALRPLADETLSASAVKQRGLFESGAVGKVIGEHRAKRHDHSRLLWALIVLEHWLARHAR